MINLALKMWHKIIFFSEAFIQERKTKEIELITGFLAYAFSGIKYNTTIFCQW